MDAISVLKDDHKLVKKLFREFEGTTDRAVKTRERLSGRIVKELSVHAAIEEEILYPRLREALQKGDRLADHALDEHQHAKELLARIEDMSGDSPELAETMGELIQAITAHVEEEEGDVFKQLREAVGRDDLTRWGDELRAAKKTAPTRPHPHAPDKPPANVLVGAVAAVLDRARDLTSPSTRWLADRWRGAQRRWRRA
ncbi:MAG TPA: hemerythrin domain-containing protein [Acidimicrobiales bacterium]|jgi:hemerythrin superfamily protein|nr:hemerythrin domain-containing protein [Acidimicrobiales bacterium]